MSAARPIPARRAVARGIVGPRGEAAVVRRIALIAGAAVLIALPYVASDFFLVQVVIRSLWLGTVAASLAFLIRFAGMISLAQTAVYGTAGYVTANLSVVRGLDPWAAAVCGVLVAALVAAVIGLLSARARGVYFLMITLTAGVFVYYFALQYRPFTFGFGGINGLRPPVLGGLAFSVLANFYFLCLAVAVLTTAGLYTYARSPLGLALQGDRDCPERMTALGLNTAAVRVVGFVVAGVVAALGGVLSVWFNGQVSPGSLDITRTIDILVIAVLGRDQPHRRSLVRRPGHLAPHRLRQRPHQLLQHPDRRRVSSRSSCSPPADCSGRSATLLDRGRHRASYAGADRGAPEPQRTRRQRRTGSCPRSR